jgi:hypothetical protein
VAILPTWAIAAVAEYDIGSIMDNIARTPPAEQIFVELRDSPAMRRMVVSSGTLSYLGPAHLIKSIRTPRIESLIFEDQQIRVERQGRTVVRLNLAREPGIHALFNGLSGLLGGDLAQIESTFAMELVIDDPHWRLILTPTDDRALKRLRQLSVSGRAEAVECIVAREDSGSVSYLIPGLSLAMLPTESMEEWLGDRCRAG